LITGPWERWYTPELAYEHEFYWPRYRDYLLNVLDWPVESVSALDMAATNVVERLTNPTNLTVHQSKGLVVGYVQSGKTANFTGVTAKAIDAGYRLIIVMTGTIEMLRSQTQRRIDMQMVGRQNIVGDFSPEQAIEAGVDYQDDEEWPQGFLDLGVDNPDPDIRRLTLHKKDYQKQFKVLKIDRFDPARALFDPENLFRTAARLVICKKNAMVLKKLVGDIKGNKSAFTEIPVLIIDDESDQASINTVNPELVRLAKTEGKEIQERRKINGLIAEMLELMPRAQYVGYTATPFANVFVDPADELGIFPKDFVLELPKPPGYMGIDDFHDIDFDPDSVRTFANSNEKALVRHLKADDADEDAQDRELAIAIDMFVLTGAIKLYRRDCDPSLRFKHHTMLVHASVHKEDHRDWADRVRRLWINGKFTMPEGRKRLRTLFEKDVVPVSTAREDPQCSLLPDFDALESYIARAHSNITEYELNPVIVVNSDAEIQRHQQELDFDKRAVWRILVGGAKLSRGFTVEGLTVTYFRRATNLGDSLTQMGRWFGFRPGYSDLVRLYIADRAKFGSKEVNIYKLFENVAKDEAAFRSQLQIYAEWDGDNPRIRPIDIPPLVSQHLPWLRPTAKSKMFNAYVFEQSEQPFTPTGYPNRLDLLRHNFDLWLPMIKSANEIVELPEDDSSGVFPAYVGIVSAEAFVATIEETLFLDTFMARVVKPKLTFYRRLVTEGDFKDLVLVVPQPGTGKSVDLGSFGKRSIVDRDRRINRGGLFGEITDPKHRVPVARYISASGNSGLERWADTQRGAALLYLVKETKPKYDPSAAPTVKRNDPDKGVVVAFSSYVPSSAMAKQPNVIRFSVRNPSKKDDPTVDAPKGAG